MKAIWSATDRGYIDEIISALKVLGKEKMICYADEINWLKQLRKRTEEDYKQQVRIQAAIAAMQGMLANPAHQKVQVESGEPFGYFYAMNAIMCADVLVAELKKGENNG